MADQWAKADSVLQWIEQEVINNLSCINDAGAVYAVVQYNPWYILTVLSFDARTFIYHISLKPASLDNAI